MYSNKMCHFLFLQGDRGLHGERGMKGVKGEMGDPGLPGQYVSQEIKYWTLT